MFDPVLFKKQFPLFDDPENASLVYLDNAATTQKPVVVIDAMVDFYKRINANANRSSHRLGRAATEKIISARNKAAEFIGARSDKEIVFTSGATESLNIIASGVSEQLKKDDEVVLSVAEHHANIVPWQEVAKKTGAKLIFLQSDFSGWESILNKKTKVVSLTAVSNTLGRISDLSIVKKIHDYNKDILTVVDASQLVAHKSINVVEIDCDFLVFSAHKMYGPSGIGVLYGKKMVLNTLSPSKFGGEMIVKVDKYHSEYIDGPERFEAGTSALAPIVGFEAAIDFLAAQDRHSIEAYEGKLSAYLHEKLIAFCQSNPEFHLLTESNNNIGIACLSSSIYALADVAFCLDEHDIAVRVGDHCAQPLWKSLEEKKPILRISLAAYNTFNDIDSLLLSLNNFIEYNQEGEKIEIDIDIDDFIATKNWQKKYKKIVQWGKGYQLSSDIRKKENLISGCEADLWLAVKKQGDTVEFVIDSDSNVVKGLALLMISRVNKKTKEEINTFDFSSFFTGMGLDKYLSSSRVNGLNALVERIKFSQ